MQYNKRDVDLVKHYKSKNMSNKTIMALINKQSSIKYTEADINSNEFDINEGKATIANRFDSQLDALIVLKVILVLAYVSLVLLCIFDILDWQVFCVYLTIPLAVDLYNSMVNYSCNSKDVPVKKWYHFPMENLSVFEKRGESAFMFRMLQARNLMIYFSLFLILSIIICLAI